MRLMRKFKLIAAALIGAAVLVPVARDRMAPERLPTADHCISPQRTNQCDADLVVQSETGKGRIWLPPGRALPRDARAPFHACEIPNLPAELPHRFIPGATVWGCELPPRLRGG
ncbi:hypothetical protein [Limimaricola litoreus]|uniref:Uncharacterized protein n=2 Tax=Limimaricola litoreus TaxID=2955316 RepID=A0A9X2FN71_9RHOB|nr:hypothetical protein [Limimaricola litoreus]